ncbi:hypothetical protein NUW54_g13867 [Trametes sanguinea]|uniref:Uncharacterized protein n=1 Tax=Trametes sanguinea TaxID=158606 RepID=A0ACC1MHU8_9APHY|nr:hypothetical protein NUW54_g13867 [Trametes sanguinea]
MFARNCLPANTPSICTPISSHSHPPAHCHDHDHPVIVTAPHHRLYPPVSCTATIRTDFRLVSISPYRASVPAFPSSPLLINNTPLSPDKTLAS